jgi:transglutaminase-like putative cysteine protease
LSRPPTSDYVDPVHGNRLLYYHDAEGEISGVYELASTLPTRVDLDTVAFALDGYDRSSAVFRTYTRSETWIEAGAPEIQELAQSIASVEKGPVMVAEEIYDYVRSSLSPEGIRWVGDHAAYRDQYGALATYLRGSGSCQNQALLFVALCRAAGIPARTVHGINSIMLGEERNLEDWSHAWAEFYLPGLGWVPVDPSGDQFAQVGKLRIILAFGNNIDLDPPCTSTDWYCHGGDALTLSYPIPYSDLHFKVTLAEGDVELR